MFGAGAGDSGGLEPNLPELSHSATTSVMVVWLAPCIKVLPTPYACAIIHLHTWFWITPHWEC